MPGSAGPTVRDEQAALQGAALQRWRSARAGEGEEQGEQVRLPWAGRGTVPEVVVVGDDEGVVHGEGEGSSYFDGVAVFF